MIHCKSENVKIPFVAIVHETEAAYLVRFDDHLDVWLPDSQVQICGMMVEMPEWLMIEKGLENYVD